MKIINRQCPHCGQPILEGALFCLDCGSRILGTALTAGARRLTNMGIPNVTVDMEDLPSGSYIFVLEGVDKGRRFDLVDKQTFIIGREDADLALQDPFISRRHTEIKPDKQRWLITDLSSTNGSFLNDVPAKGQELLDGDIIEVGYSTLMFRSKL